MKTRHNAAFKTLYHLIWTPSEYKTEGSILGETLIQTNPWAREIGSNSFTVRKQLGWLVDQGYIQSAKIQYGKCLVEWFLPVHQGAKDE